MASTDQAPGSPTDDASGAPVEPASPAAAGVDIAERPPTELARAESVHGPSLLHMAGKVGLGLLLVVLGGGLIVLEVAGQLEKPWLGIPFGLLLFGFGVYTFWLIKDDRKMRVELGAEGVVYRRAGDEVVFSWLEVTRVSWLQSGSAGKVKLVELQVELSDGTDVVLPLERLSGVKKIAGAFERYIGAEFPEH